MLKEVKEEDRKGGKKKGSEGGRFEGKKGGRNNNFSESQGVHCKIRVNLIPNSCFKD